MSKDKWGLIQIFTGDGKGKTTAALGEVMRCVGAGKRAAVLFFDKGGRRYSERAALDRLGVDWWAFGRDRRLQNGSFDFSVTDQDRTEAACGLDKLSQLLESKQYDLIVLDELNTTTSLGVLKVGQVLQTLDARSDTTELVLTGRNAPQEFLDRADLISEIQNKKHYMSSGVPARVGLDY